MSTHPIDIEWLNQNSLRNYPFREDCGLRPNDSAGNLIDSGFRVPNYLVTDLVVGVPASVYSDAVEVYLKKMSVTDDPTNGISVVLTFASSDGTDAFTASCVESGASAQVKGLGAFSSVSGVVRFGDIERFADEFPHGLYSFSKSESLIEPTCVRPAVCGVEGISAVDASGYTTAPLSGIVKLVAGDNVSIKYDVDRNALVFSADPNSGYTSGCDCDEDELSVVRSINGIKTEDVVIEGDDCVVVSTENGVIKISDGCSKPCCGCAETAFINQSINDLQSSVNTLSNNASLLADRVTNFVNNYLLARKSLA